MRHRPVSFAIALLAIVLAGCSKPEPASTTAASSGAAAASATPAVSALDAGPRAAESPVDEVLEDEGEKLFKDKGCSACHTFGKKLTGPDLAGVSKRRTAMWIERQILHPEQMVKEDPIAKQLMATYMLQMPNQGLTEAQAKALIEYFKHQDDESDDKD
jgi:mono/diheme cytochrome c family protein